MYGHFTYQIDPKLESDDEAKIAAIYAAAFRAQPWCEKWTLRTALKEVRSDAQKKRMILVFHEEEIAGFGIAQPLANYPGAADLFAMGIRHDAYYIKELVTAASHRRKGICSAIIALYRAIAAIDHSQIVLRTRFDNRALFGPVRINGFTEIGEYNAVTGNQVSVRKVFAADLHC